MSKLSPKGFLNSRLWTLIKVFFAVGMFAYVLAQTDFEQIITLKDRFSWDWLFLSFLSFIAMLLVKTYQYYLFTERKLGYFKLLEIIVIQNALMNFVATAAGIASYLTMLSVEEDVRLGKATESFVMVKIGDVLAVSFYLFVSLLFIRPVPRDVSTIAFVSMAFAVIFFISLIALIFMRNQFFSGVVKIAGFFKLDQIGLVQKVLGYLKKIAAYPHNKLRRMVMQASLISLVYMGLTMLWGYARFESFSLHIDLYVVVFIMALFQFLSWIPIYIFGGLGITEGFSIYLLGLFLTESVPLAAILVGMRVALYLLNASSLIYLPIYAAFSHSSAVK